MLSYRDLDYQPPVSNLLGSGIRLDVRSNQKNPSDSSHVDGRYHIFLNDAAKSAPDDVRAGLYAYETSRIILRHNGLSFLNRMLLLCKLSRFWPGFEAKEARLAIEGVIDNKLTDVFSAAVHYKGFRENNHKFGGVSVQGIEEIIKTHRPRLY